MYKYSLKHTHMCIFSILYHHNPHSTSQLPHHTNSEFASVFEQLNKEKYHLSRIIRLKIFHLNPYPKVYQTLFPKLLHRFII